MSSTIFVIYNIEGSVYFIEIQVIYTIIQGLYTNYIIYIAKLGSNNMVLVPIQNYCYALKEEEVQLIYLLKDTMNRQ